MNYRQTDNSKAQTRLLFTMSRSDKRPRNSFKNGETDRKNIHKFVSPQAIYNCNNNSRQID